MIEALPEAARVSLVESMNNDPHETFVAGTLADFYGAGFNACPAPEVDEVVDGEVASLRYHRALPSLTRSQVREVAAELIQEKTR